MSQKPFSHFISQNSDGNFSVWAKILTGINGQKGENERLATSLKILLKKPFEASYISYICTHIQQKKFRHYLRMAFTSYELKFGHCSLPNRPPDGGKNASSMLNATIADFIWPIPPVAMFIQTNHLHVQLQLLIPTLDRRNYSCLFFSNCLYVCMQVHG
jgi:hypothetical protein